MSWRDYYKSGFSSPFGEDRGGGRKHRGQDMSHSRTPGTIGVPNMHDGVVISKTAPSPSHGFGYGITIQSRLADGNLYNISYSHGPWASQQKIGEFVPAGKIILHEGTSGATQGSCVHIEQQRVGGGFLDPRPEINRVAAGGGGSTPTPSKPGFSQTVKNEQAWLISRGYNLGPTGADGIAGPYYHAAVQAYQTYLKGRGWYSGAIDGKWGPGTQAGHEKFYAEVNAPKPAPAPNYPIVNLDNIATIGDVRGLQKIARANGGATAIDNRWGPNSKKGLANYLNRNYGGSITNWLRKRWGYVGNDQLGPQMIAALQRANAENFRVL